MEYCHIGPLMRRLLNIIFNLVKSDRWRRIKDQCGTVRIPRTKMSRAVLAFYVSQDSCASSSSTSSTYSRCWTTI